MIGTPRETVTCHFAEWKKQKIVEGNGSVLTAKDSRPGNEVVFPVLVPVGI
jgi:hypothetical protein